MGNAFRGLTTLPCNETSQMPRVWLANVGAVSNDSHPFAKVMALPLSMCGSFYANVLRK